MEIFHISSLHAAIFILIGMSLIINKASDVLGDNLSAIGRKLKIPTSVRGATFDAVSSSMPELITALIAVLVYGRFEDIGFATIAGSGIFNVLLIPMLAIVFYKTKTNSLVSIDKKVVWRDVCYYTGSLLILLISILMEVLGWYTGLCLLVWYGVYIYHLYRETKNYQNSLEEETIEAGNIWKMGFFSLVSLFFIWIAIDSIIQAAILISTTLNIPQYIISLVILAGCTSIPDTLLSIKSSRNGDLEGSVANAVGSNIFDVTVCLGLPLLFVGSINIQIGDIINLFGFLFLSMAVTASVLLKNNLKKSDSLIMAFYYLVFLTFVIIQVK